MSNGLRFFLVDGDDITHLPLKLTEDFFLRQGKFLPQYAGQDITIATVSYELEGRKPTLITAIGCRGYRLTEDGLLDEADFKIGVLAGLDGTDFVQTCCSTSVRETDAKAGVDQQLPEPRNPKLSGLAHQRILETLFK